MQVWIGTSGYSYTDWVGPFYPPGTKPAQMLAHYSREFPLVELNFTFYRPPTPSMLTSLADKSPADFQFIVKLPRTLSHEQNPRDLDGFRQAAEAMQSRGKLLGLLCQLPQSQHYKPRHCTWIETLGRELAGLGLAVEFRHYSWYRSDVPDWLRGQQIDLVSVDVPDIPALYPRGLVRSGSRVYIRWHSRNAAAWYAGDKERYDYLYSDAELREWITALAGQPEPPEQALLLLNNCHRGQAVENARSLRALLGRLAPGMHVVPPPSDPGAEPRQRSLFE